MRTAKRAAALRGAYQIAPLTPVSDADSRAEPGAAEPGAAEPGATQRRHGLGTIAVWRLKGRTPSARSPVAFLRAARAETCAQLWSGRSVMLTLIVALVLVSAVF